MTSAASANSRLSHMHSANMFISDSESSVSSEESSSSSSSTGASPRTPTSAMNQCSCSDGDSDSSDATPRKHNSASCAANESIPEPVFSSIPTRRVQSSSAVYRRSMGAGIQMAPCTSPTSPVSPTSASPTSATFPRRTPSFPVSRPIRPFDSISNAMGTAPKRVSPPLSRAESFAPSTGAAEERLSMKPKGLSVQTTGLETGKQKKSNVLLAPPKSNRFQHGFFILDMTQDEFKTRAW